MGADHGIFTHDCSVCEYQFSTIDTDMTYDVYTCGQGYDRSVILRYGNKPEENKSFPHFIAKDIKSGDWKKVMDALKLKESLSI